MAHCQLLDLGYEGDVFTWRNHNHSAEKYIRERLDRAMANDGWRRCFPTVHVINSDPRHSDHRPVIIQTEGREKGCTRGSKRAFHFEVGWLGEDKCAEVVGDSWQATMEAPSRKVRDAVKAVAVGLSDWSHNVLGDLEKWVKHVKKELEENRR